MADNTIEQTKMGAEEVSQTIATLSEIASGQRDGVVIVLTKVVQEDGQISMNGNVFAQKTNPMEVIFTLMKTFNIPKDVLQKVVNGL